MGCQLEVTVPEKINGRIDTDAIQVTGNSCLRGIAYGKKEVTAPTRTLTCTAAVTSGKRPLVSAKTDGEVPKELLLSCMQAVRRLTIKAPIKAGQVLQSDLLHTGINLIACEDID